MSVSSVPLPVPSRLRADMPILAALALAALPPEAAMWVEAGYGHGADLPRPTAVRSVADHGARPDDGKDDTEAFENALALGGVIALPAGEFTLSRRLHARKPGTVLLGAGSGSTFLRFTKSLQELDPRPDETATGEPTTFWSWAGGLLVFHGSGKGGAVAPVAPARRGDTSLRLASPLALVAGQEVVLTLRGDSGKRLALHLYAGDAGDSSNLRSPREVRMSARVASVQGSEVRLTTPLLVDLPEEFQPTLAVAPPPTNSGIRGVGFRLTRDAYRGHFKEDGWNALEFSGVRHAWADDIRIAGADSGIFVGGSHVTLRNLVFEGGRPPSRQGYVGHHGVSLGGSANRLENFDFQTRFHHDITFFAWTNGNVVRSGYGKGLTFDFHKRGPFGNLITQVGSGDGATLFRTGGGPGLGRSAGAWNCFWGIRARDRVEWPDADFAPARATAFMGVEFVPASKPPYHAARIRPGEPIDLWVAARQRR